MLNTTETIERNEKILRFTFKAARVCAYLVMLFPFYCSLFLVIFGPIGIVKDWEMLFGWTLGFGIVPIIQGFLLLLCVEVFFHIIAKLMKLSLIENGYNVEKTVLKRHVPGSVLAVILILSLALIAYLVAYHGM